MRIIFSDPKCPNVASKYLIRFSPKLKLSTTQEAVAKATGYRDWHDLQANLNNTGKTETSDQVIVEVISDLADRLGILEGDVQYALTKARMFYPLLDIRNQLRIKAMLIRRRTLGEAKSGKIGSIVSFKSDHRGDIPGYIIPNSERRSSGTCILFDWGTTLLNRSEIIVPKLEIADFIPARYWLPYGYYTLQDGSKVVYSCNYLPLWRISSNGVERLDPWCRINGEIKNLNFGESLGIVYWEIAARDLALAFLREHRVIGLPRLVDAMPLLFEPGVANNEEAIELLRKRLEISEVAGFV